MVNNRAHRSLIPGREKRLAQLVKARWTTSQGEVEASRGGCSLRASQPAHRTNRLFDRLASPHLNARESVMHAVVVNVTIADRDAAVAELRDRVVPMASGMPGFVAGHWVALSDDKGMALVVFDSEASAQALAGQVAPQPGSAVTIEGVEVGEVVAHA
jgi:hypothetical protein